MEKTLVIFKPDCFEKRLVGDVLGRLERAGFELVGAKVTTLSSELLKEHYAHITHLPFFPEIEDFMSKRPVLIAALQSENAVAKLRKLLGPTDSDQAPAGTIRGDYGTDKMRNILHASDSVEAAEQEIKRFFEPGEVQ